MNPSEVKQRAAATLKAIPLHMRAKVINLIKLRQEEARKKNAST
jgi:hypothetical protein